MLTLHIELTRGQPGATIWIERLPAIGSQEVVFAHGYGAYSERLEVDEVHTHWGTAEAKAANDA